MPGHIKSNCPKMFKKLSSFGCKSIIIIIIFNCLKKHLGYAKTYAYCSPNLSDLTNSTKKNEINKIENFSSNDPIQQQQQQKQPSIKPFIKKKTFCRSDSEDYNSDSSLSIKNNLKSDDGLFELFYF